MARLALDHFVDKLFQNLSKNAQIFFEIDAGGVRMTKYFLEIDLGGVRRNSYGSVWTRMSPYGP